MDNKAIVLGIEEMYNYVFLLACRFDRLAVVTDDEEDRCVILPPKPPRLSPPSLSVCALSLMPSSTDVEYSI
jgi:hypothetical protein